MRKDGNTDGWIIPLEFDKFPDFKDMTAFLDEVSEKYGHDVVECYVMMDECKNVVYSKGILSKRDYEVMAEFVLQG